MLVTPTHLFSSVPSQVCKTRVLTKISFILNESRFSVNGLFSVLTNILDRLIFLFHKKTVHFSIVNKQIIMINPKFYIETELSQQALLNKLKLHEPWRMGISFSNGVNTADLRTIEPFSDMPLNKLKWIAEHGGENALKDKRVLDIGSNIGYNAIILSRDFGCKVTGLEFDLRNIEKAKMIADLCGAEVEFLQGDAGSFSQPGEYDVILHLGTLYHLADPVAALKCSATNLKAGGLIYIESAIYEADDEYACRFIHGYGNDYTNYWALSSKVISEILERYGFSKVEKIRDVNIKSYQGTGMSRALFFAEKL